MNGSAWKYRFNPVILARGEDIYYSGRIDQIRRTKKGWEASAYGTDVYDVEIVMENGEVSDMSCTCPYAEDGLNCKHMAALLFALEDEDAQEVCEAGEDPYDILESMNEEQLKNELREIMEEDSTVRSRILSRYRKRPADRNDVRRIKEMLERLAYTCGDRDGFVDWQHGSKYVNAFDGCLRDSVGPMLKRGEYMTAFEALSCAFRVLNNVEMDGSDGEHSDIAYTIEDYWRELIRLCSEEERDQMHSWFEKMNRNADSLICGDSITDTLETAFEDEKYLLPLIRQTEEKLNEPDIPDYSLKSLLEKYRSFLERAGKSMKPYDEALERFKDRIAVKEILLEVAQAHGDTGREIALLEELAAMDDVKWRKEERLRRLLEIYENENEEEKIKSVLMRLVRETGSANMETVRRLRRLCGPNEWEEMREEILASYPRLSLEVLHEEKLYDRLIGKLKDEPIITAEKYREELQHRYPEEYLGMYMKYLGQLGERHPCTAVYSEMRTYLLKTAEIPGARCEVVHLITAWQNAYPTRHAMQRMLAEVLREI